MIDGEILANFRMKKIIIFEGIDGSGKSTLQEYISRELNAQGIACEIYDRYHPSELTPFFQMEEKQGIRLSDLDMLYWRLSRLTYRLAYTQKSLSQAFLVDRGLVDVWVRACMAYIPEKTIIPIFQMVISEKNNLDITTAFLKTSLKESQNRVKQRVEMSKNDQDINFQTDYFSYLNEAIEKNICLGRLLKVDTNLFSPIQCSEYIINNCINLD